MWLLKRAAILITLSIAFILLMKLVGSTRPDPMHPLFTNPDGSACQMPCLFGIRPGITTLGEAAEFIHHHPLTRDLVEVPLPPNYYQSIKIYLGKNDQIIKLQFFAQYMPPRADTQDESTKIVTHLDLNSFNATSKAISKYSVLYDIESQLNIPSISPELRNIWHYASFKQMLVTLGIPQDIGLPYKHSPISVGGDDFLESTYFDSQMSIAHAGAVTLPDLHNNNYFSSICVFMPTVYMQPYGCALGNYGKRLPYSGLMAMRKYKILEFSTPPS